MKKILREVLVNLLTEGGKTLSCILLAAMLNHLQIANIEQVTQPTYTDSGVDIRRFQGYWDKL